MVCRFFLPVACILGGLRSCIAALFNRTIDDTKGDPVTGFLPVYAPEAQWNVGTNCTGCLVQPDIGQLFDYTWHDTTQGDGGISSSVTLNFTGTAIYLFAVVPNTIPFATTLVNLKFTLDGTPIGTYTHIPNNSSDFLYSVPVLSSQDISNEAHTLVAETASNSLFVFDFAMYTFDDSPGTLSSVVSPVSTTQASATPISTATSRDHVPPVGAIAAGSISGFAVVVLSLFAILCLRRRKRRRLALGEDSENGPHLRSQSSPGTGWPVESSSLPLTSLTSLEEPALPPYAPEDPYAIPSGPGSTEPSTVHMTRLELKK